MNAHSSENHGAQLGHILPFSYYRNTLIALLVLTVVTVGVSYIHFESGIANIMVAMFIASIKAVLVALFFMHLRYESPFTWLYAAFPIILLVILIGGVFLDNPFRPDAATLGHAPVVQTEHSSMPTH